jgi:hypothetical protein
MFSLLKLLIYIVGLAIVAYLALPYFGYEVNLNYFNESKEACQKRLNDCTIQYVEQGTKNAKCNFDCVNPKLIINKK